MIKLDCFRMKQWDIIILINRKGLFMKKYFWFTALFIAFVLASTKGQAYIMPSYHILNKTVFHNGQGLYQIVLDVTLNEDADKGHIQETWWIENENSMRVDVKGVKDLAGKFQFSILYKNKKRYSSWSNLNDKPYSDEFSELPFHFRDQTSFAQWLVNQKMADSSVFKKPVFIKNTPKNFTESFVRLSKCAGTICYALGEPTPTNSSVESPGIWIEQDQFVIRKLRFPSETVIQVKSFADYSKGLNYPLAKTITWGVHNVELKTLSVHSKSVSPQMSKILSREASLLPAIVNLDEIPSQLVIEEFYLRFR